MTEVKNGARPFWKFTAVATAIVAGAAALHAVGVGAQKIAITLSIPDRMTQLELKVGDVDIKVDKILRIVEARD